MVLIISIVGIIYSSYYIITYINEYRVSEKKYEEIETIYHQNEGDPNEELKRINEDFVGWIEVDGTEIQYPVVQAVDNDYYLTRNFHQEEDKVGAIFMDYRNSTDRLDSHTIIYGHNMKDDSMFGSLSNVLDADFSDDNTINLEFQGETYQWEVFSGYVTKETDWMQVDFDSTNNSYLPFLQGLKDKSNVIFSREEVTKEDKILTLATCTSHDIDERVIVHARLIEGD
ncbi:class B sortase [Oceanobacillus halophilus]|uniref:class B sortase n=1 Tax=Oceanobacillus halophilus TaxID=930130 RepID=UPI001314B084|nr:class B sortase [Oceanobacillus halophilus]